ncbi:MAG: tRNA dihydrouridine synthase DusB [Calditrichaeota bacterium]|nr:tRNA dihydrouridine synthase DusB [Calditrichota bacterium]
MENGNEKPGYLPLAIGPLRIWPPVVLSPMAGVTNAAFRSLCAEFGAGLFVGEMVHARLLVEGDPYTVSLARFAPDEAVRSIQLYGTDPGEVAAAVRLLVAEHRVDHVDLNFGCPVRKVLKKGGGAALLLNLPLFARIVRAAVRAAGAVPVTVKFRMGVDAQRLTYLEAGQIAVAEGVAAITLHARTAEQLYSGNARWEAIARLKERVRDVPIIGNGDVRTADDALLLMRKTGCDGVGIGRGVLGRPWLFQQLSEAFNGLPVSSDPEMTGVVAVIKRHLRVECQYRPQAQVLRNFRKHLKWYLDNFAIPTAWWQRLFQADTLAELIATLNHLANTFGSHPNLHSRPFSIAGNESVEE